MCNELQGTCWRCGHPLRQTDYGYSSICPGCRTATRVCRNCRFFCNSAPNQCNQPAAGPIIDKQRANRCDYFQILMSSGGAGSMRRDRGPG